MRILVGILFSFAIHLAMGWGIRHMPDSWTMPLNPPGETTEVVILERPASNKENPVVREAKAPDALLDDESKEKARFLSANNQRVIQETRAPRVGLTRNGRALPEDSWMKAFKQTPGTKTAKNEDSPTPPERRETSPDGYEPIPLPRPNSGIAFDDAPSAVGEVLPDDIAHGEFTALNTDRFKFYSFYARVEELVRYRWERDLQKAIDNFDSRYLTNVIGKKDWVTRVEFLLTPEGRFHSATIEDQSGIRRFDLAAINAFREAGVFPNPPEEMVEADGFVRIKYSFNVHWSPSAMAGSN